MYLQLYTLTKICDIVIVNKLMAYYYTCTTLYGMIQMGFRMSF